MKKIILVLVFGLFIQGCGDKKSGSPQETATLFVIAVLNDISSIKYDLLTPESKKHVDDLVKEYKARGIGLKPSDLIVSIPQSRDDWLGKKRSKLLSSENGMASVEISTTSSETAKVVVNLKKYKGKWRVVLFEKSRLSNE
jgi:hypothetical protein